MIGMRQFDNHNYDEIIQDFSNKACLEMKNKHFGWRQYQVRYKSMASLTKYKYKYKM